MPRYRIVMCCEGIPPQHGAAGAECIAAGFEKRYWHWNVTCTWDGSVLTLVAENDDDREGKALSDEFSDEICACLPPFDGDMRIVSVDELRPDA